MRACVALIALVALGCQAGGPRPLRAPRPVAPAVLESFALAPPASDPALAPIHVLGSSPEADQEGVEAPAAALEFEELLSSVERHFPLILAAREEVEIAEGRLTRARGGFDTRLSSRGLTEAEGFYQSDRFEIGLEQQTALWGAKVKGGYRLGQGDFAVYDGGEKTNEDGEFKVGLSLPLLQGRAIDPRRVALWKAEIQRAEAAPKILQKRLAAMRKAADVYWKWVAAGRQREVAQRLLALAQDRTQQLQLAVDEGLLAPINLTENQRLIVDRKAKRIRAELKLQETAIELSLYWRDAAGRPRVPTNAALPYEFPAPRDIDEVLVSRDEPLGLEQRPEVRAIELKLQRLRLDRDQVRNAELPRLDLDVYASQDIGAAANTPDDKGDFELTALLTLDVPLQRRSARGLGRELEGRIAQLDREAQFVREVVVSQIREARAALTQSWLRITQARENVRLANELADAERFQLREGQSDLLRVNLREQQAAVAAAALVDDLQAYFLALTTYRAVLGIPHGLDGA